MPATQLQRARAGEITPAMRRVAERENREPETVRQQVADGQAVIPNNHAHDALDEETDLKASEAAEVNLPPVGTHDTSSVPDE